MADAKKKTTRKKKAEETPEAVSEETVEETPVAEDAPVEEPEAEEPPRQLVDVGAASIAALALVHAADGCLGQRADHGVPGGPARYSSQFKSHLPPEQRKEPRAWTVTTSAPLAPRK